MAIITKPASVQKNSPATFTLNKSALAAVPSVVADDYFSDSDNWKKVFIYYKSSTGNQKEVLKFNAELASPTANFLVSDKALDIFEVQKIVIVDFDNGSITVPRSQLTVADFDVDTTPPSGPTALFTRDFSNVSMPSTLDLEEVTGLNASISGGYFQLYAFDQYNRTNYVFDVAASVSGLSSSPTSVTIRLTLAPSNEAVAGMKVSFSGGYQTSIEHVITSQDISNGYIEFLNVAFANNYGHYIFFNTVTPNSDTYLRISKLEIL